MKCPNCSAECSDQAEACDFCGYEFVATSAKADSPTSSVEPPVPPAPPSPPPMNQAPPIIPSTPQHNPYQDSPQSARPNQTVPNHLTFAIVTAIVSTITNFLGCCCFPISLVTGITAVVFAMKVDKLVDGDDIAGALQASKTAKMWCWVTTVLGIVFGLWFIVSLFLQETGYLDPEAMQEMLKQMGAGR